MFLSGEKLEGGKCISVQGSSVKGSSQQSSTSGPKVKGGGPIIFRLGPTYYGGLVNDTTPGTGLGKMGSYNMLCTVDTTQGQGQGTGTGTSGFHTQSCSRAV